LVTAGAAVSAGNTPADRQHHHEPAEAQTRARDATRDNVLAELHDDLVSQLRGRQTNFLKPAAQRRSRNTHLNARRPRVAQLGQPLIELDAEHR